MKSTKGLVWYGHYGKNIKREVQTDIRIVWEMLLSNYKDIPYATKLFRNHIGLTNENVHKIENDER